MTQHYSKFLNRSQFGQGGRSVLSRIARWGRTGRTKSSFDQYHARKSWNNTWIENAD